MYKNMYKIMKILYNYQMNQKIYKKINNNKSHRLKIH